MDFRRARAGSYRWAWRLHTVLRTVPSRGEHALNALPRNLSLENALLMKTNLPIGLLCGLLGVLIGLSGWLSAEAVSAPAAAPRAIAPPPVVSGDRIGGDPIRVELASGRVFVADLDARTDAEVLWLRWQRGTVVLRRPIRWDRVVRAKVGGEELSGEEFRKMVEAVRREHPRDAKKATPPKRMVIPGARASIGQ